MEDDGDGIEIIPPSNLLRAKLGVTDDVGEEMDLEALQRAEEAVEELQDSYPEWVKPEVDLMASILNELKALSGEEQTKCLEEIFDLAHNIKGQGTSFGYPLMTQIGESLCDFLRTSKTMDGAAFQLIESHILAMQAVIRDRVCNEDDALGVKTVSELRAAGARLA